MKRSQEKAKYWIIVVTFWYWFLIVVLCTQFFFHKFFVVFSYLRMLCFAILLSSCTHSHGICVSLDLRPILFELRRTIGLLNTRATEEDKNNNDKKKPNKRKTPVIEWPFDWKCKNIYGFIWCETKRSKECDREKDNMFPLCFNGDFLLFRKTKSRNIAMIIFMMINIEYCLFREDHWVCVSSG